MNIKIKAKNLLVIDLQSYIHLYPLSVASHALSNYYSVTNILTDSCSIPQCYVNRRFFWSRSNYMELKFFTPFNCCKMCRRELCTCGYRDVLKLRILHDTHTWIQLVYLYMLIIYLYRAGEPVWLLRFWPDQYFKLQRYFF